MKFLALMVGLILILVCNIVMWKLTKSVSYIVYTIILGVIFASYLVCL